MAPSKKRSRRKANPRAPRNADVGPSNRKRRVAFKQRLSKSYLFIPLVISGSLNLTGLAGIVEGVVVWVGFFRDALDLYAAHIRTPAMTAVAHVWPSFLPPIPRWIYDVAVIWLAFGFANRVINTFVAWDDIMPPEWEEKMKPYTGFRGAIRDLKMGPLSIGEYLLIYWMGKFVNLSQKKKPDDVTMSQEEWEVFAPTALRSRELIVTSLLWYFWIFSAFLVILFVNYQLARVR